MKKTPEEKKAARELARLKMRVTQLTKEVEITRNHAATQIAFRQQMFEQKKALQERLENVKVALIWVLDAHEELCACPLCRRCRRAMNLEWKLARGMP